MIQATAQTKILVAQDPLDFRFGIDATARFCRSGLQEDPMSGSMFVFCNRKRTQVRLLFYDGQGYWLCTKRLSKGRFPLWNKDQMVTRIFSEQLFSLLRGGNPLVARGLDEWRPIS